MDTEAMIQQVESLLPEGTDPAEFWASLSEAIARMSEQQEQAHNDHDETTTPTVADVVQVRDAVDIRAGEINPARFEIHAVEGGRYGEVSVTPVDDATDTSVKHHDPTAGFTASGQPRQRARRADPDAVAGHVFSTMESVVEAELRAPRVKRGADVSITWVLENPKYDATTHAHYTYYNSRSLMDDVLSIHNQSYTKAQLRSAVKRLITNGVVVESGKNSKATRYTLEPSMYAALVTRAKNEEDA